MTVASLSGSSHRLQVTKPLLQPKRGRATAADNSNNTSNRICCNYSASLLTKHNLFRKIRVNSFGSAGNSDNIALLRGGDDGIENCHAMKHVGERHRVRGFARGPHPANARQFGAQHVKAGVVARSRPPPPSPVRSAQPWQSPRSGTATGQDDGFQQGHRVPYAENSKLVAVATEQKIRPVAPASNRSMIVVVVGGTRIIPAGDAAHVVHPAGEFDHVIERMQADRSKSTSRRLGGRKRANCPAR